MREWKIGDRVFGIIGGGGQAEYVTVPANHLARIPDRLDWPEAAAVPEVFMTAHDALFTQCRVTIGEHVLIHAAGSGVGTAAIQRFSRPVCFQDCPPEFLPPELQALSK